jgi:hypothetical protein
MPSRRGADYEALSPYRILRALPALASNRVPEDIGRACGGSPLPAWQLLEEGVFFFFRQMLMLETVKLGAASLFAQEPEGIVLVDREPRPFALLYECKARARGYEISADDALRYREYIKSMRHEVQVKYHLRLSHFVIVSSYFRGGYMSKVEDLGSDGTVVSLAKADGLTGLYDVARKLDFARLRLVDLQRIFCRGLASCERLGV